MLRITFIKNHRYCTSRQRHRHSTRASEADWRKVADRGLEIVICVGHIFGVIMLIADHLL